MVVVFDLGESEVVVVDVGRLVELMMKWWWWLGSLSW